MFQETANEGDISVTVPKSLNLRCIILIIINIYNRKNMIHDLYNSNKQTI